MATYNTKIKEGVPFQRSVELSHGDDEQVSLIRKELKDLTGELFSAVILNQLLYWTLRVKDFDLFLEEEKELGVRVQEGSAHPSEVEEVHYHGWIYKTASDLIEETLLGITHPTMRKYLKFLVDQGWIDERPNPLDRWNKTTQYRVNIRNIQADLRAMGRKLPGIYLKAFSEVLVETYPKAVSGSTSLNEGPTKANNRKTSENATSLPLTTDRFGSDVRGLDLRSFDLNVENLHSDVSSFPSNVKILQSDVKSLQSNVKNLHSYTYTENKTEIINKEHTQRTRAREADQKNDDLKKSERRQKLGSFATLGAPKTPEDSEVSLVSASLSQLPESALESMAAAWKVHVGQEVRLTAEHKNGLQSILKTYFQNDLSQWMHFCKRVGSSPFLMGQGARKWRVSLDWILVEENLLKVLEGNFDDGKLLDQKIERAFENARTNEVRTVLESIVDPVWREWCSQLNFSPESHDYVSLSDLKTIANATFLEIEGDRLVWIGSFDVRALSKIEDLRLKILPIVQGTFPQARTTRTRLMSESASSPQSDIPDPSQIPEIPTQYKGDHHYA